MSLALREEEIIRYFLGMIDEVRIWDRALSEEEINKHKDQGHFEFFAVDPQHKLTTTWGNLKIKYCIKQVIILGASKRSFNCVRKRHLKNLFYLYEEENMKSLSVILTLLTFILAFAACGK